MTTTTHPLMPGVLAALRAEPQTLPEIRRRIHGALGIDRDIALALAALAAAGRAERVTLESGGWVVTAWRVAKPSHAEARSPQRDPTNSVCSAIPAPPRDTCLGSEVAA